MSRLLVLVVLGKGCTVRLIKNASSQCHLPIHQEKPPQLSEDNLAISALSEKKRSIRAPQSTTIRDASSGDNISLIFYETIR